jgi:hypothetical protein
MTAIDNDNHNTLVRRQPDVQPLISEGESRIMPHTLTSDSSMKLIPWEDIWTSLRVATIRDNGEMIEIFYDTLFKEAIFDDQGAWSLPVRR